MSNRGTSVIGKLLGLVYGAAGALAALFLVGIGVSIVIQVVCRYSGVTFDATELAGFCLAASTFLGLAYTFRAGGHVRITLAIDRFAPGPRRFIEAFCCLVALIGVGFLGWHVLQLTLQSYAYHDVSPGLLAIPFWIPQSGMALGVLLFALALLEEFIRILGGATPRYVEDDPTVHPE